MLKAISRNVMKNRLLTDRQGNFGIITAILLPVLLGAGGVALELGNALQTRTSLQNTADAATLAVASQLMSEDINMTEEEAEQSAERYLRGNLSAFVGDENGDEKSEAEAAEKLEELISNSVLTVKITPTTYGNTYKVTANINYPVQLNPLVGLLGSHTMNVSITSTAESSSSKGAPMSMYLVLDRSGSMSFKSDTVDTTQTSCANYTSNNWSSYPNLRASRPCYDTKAKSLKKAVSFMVSTLHEKDPTFKNATSELVRTGAVSYNDAQQSAQGITWGTSKVETYVNNIPNYPTGGTNAKDAMTTAYNALKKSNTTEALAHKEKSNTAFDRYIVFMTDGEMTGSSANWNASIDASVAAVCETAKKDGITIFAIAFMAPANGKTLLNKCATQGNYYEPDDQVGIVAAFGDIARKAANNMSRLTN